MALSVAACSPAASFDPKTASHNAQQTPRVADAIQHAPRVVEAHSGPRAAPHKDEPTWAEFDAATFARAKRENKFIVLHGAAEWCHWCHVMEATTYHDADVRNVLDKSFIAVKVDSDARPDVQERYEAWGWPATVIFAPDATEVAKYRGYIEPEKFRELLEQIAARGAESVIRAPAASTENPKTPLATEHLAWIRDLAATEVDEYYDAEQGSWGRGQKAPIGSTNAWKLRLASRGDTRALKEITFTLDQQAKLIDPVWGGIYQYSTDGDWEHPHFEKLMTFQAPAIENYAEAYALTKDEKQLARAKSIRAYVDRFMRGPEGAFYTTQDADLHAHEADKPFVDGHDYYVLGEKERLARGLPRIDKHEYARENGLGIAAYVAYARATGDKTALTEAERAAKRILATHKTAKGGVAHDQKPNDKVLFLADNAAFAYGLARLAEATGDVRFWKEARAVADYVLRELQDPRSGGFFSATQDPDAAGVFAERRVPFEDNVSMIRALLLLASQPKSDARGRYTLAAERSLRAISTVPQIKGRARWVGDYLLAVDDALVARGKSGSK